MVPARRRLAKPGEPGLKSCECCRNYIRQYPYFRTSGSLSLLSSDEVNIILD